MGRKTKSEKKPHSRSSGSRERELERRIKMIEKWVDRQPDDSRYQKHGGHCQDIKRPKLSRGYSSGNKEDASGAPSPGKSIRSWARSPDQTELPRARSPGKSTRSKARSPDQTELPRARSPDQTELTRARSSEKMKTSRAYSSDKIRSSKADSPDGKVRIPRARSPGRIGHPVPARKRRARSSSGSSDSRSSSRSPTKRKQSKMTAQSKKPLQIESVLPHYTLFHL